MKNHEWVDGKLLQTNKKYSHLKLKQKEKIYQWMYDSYRKDYEEKGAYPDDKEDDRILFRVMEQIERAEIWIPYGEVRKHYRSVKKNLHKRLAKEKESQAVVKLKIETLDTTFSICKVENYSEVNIEEPFCFIGSTDEEKSLVCPTQQIPAHYLKREDGWRGFRIAGVLDFSLIGIMARITKVLANNEIGVFVVSTFNLMCYTSKSHAEREWRKGGSWDICSARNVLNNMFNKDSIGGLIFNPDDEGSLVLCMKFMLQMIMPGNHPKPPFFQDTGK